MSVTITDAGIPESASSQGENTFLGPFKDSNDNLYVVSEYASAADQIDVFKSADDGATWSRVDTANHPSTMTGGLAVLSAILDGTTIHILAISGFDSGGMSVVIHVEYHTFHTSDAGGTADTWQITNESVSNASQSGTEYPRGDIAVRSDGDVIVIYTGEVSVMGNGMDHVFYARREGGTWTSNIDLQASHPNANDYQWRGGVCVMGANDECHIFFNRFNSGVQGITLDASNNLSTEIGVITTSLSHWPSSRPVWWNDGTDDHILTDGGGQVRRLIEDANGDVALETGQGVAFTGVSALTAGHVHFPGPNNHVYAFGSHFALDNDLWYFSSPNGDDASWGDQSDEIEDGVNVANYYTSATYFVRGGSDVIGIVWWNAITSTLEYSEHDLGGSQEIEVMAASESEDAVPVLVGVPFVFTPQPNSNVGPFISPDGDLYVITLKDQGASLPNGELTVWKSEDFGDSWHDTGVVINPPDDVSFTSMTGVAPHIWGVPDSYDLDIFWTWRTSAEPLFTLGHVLFDMNNDTVGSVTEVTSPLQYVQVVKRSNGNFVIVGYQRSDQVWELYEGVPGSFTLIHSEVLPEESGSRRNIGIAQQGDVVHIAMNVHS